MTFEWIKVVKIPIPAMHMKNLQLDFLDPHGSFASKVPSLEWHFVTVKHICLLELLIEWVSHKQLSKVLYIQLGNSSSCVPNNVICDKDQWLLCKG